MAATRGPNHYDRIGSSYSGTRRSDPRIAAFDAIGEDSTAAGVRRTSGIA